MDCFPFIGVFFWNKERREIIISTDAGRLTRPLFYIQDGKVSNDTPLLQEGLEVETLTWKNMYIRIRKKENPYHPR